MWIFNDDHLPVIDGVTETAPAREDVRVPTCHRCGAVQEPDGPATLAWASEREPDGGSRWLCPECARRHVRDIEAKLPPEWW